MVVEKWSQHAETAYAELIQEELKASVHGEVDDESWLAKQNLLRRQSGPVKRGSPLFLAYLRQSFIDTLTLYLHGICCDIDVETGPRQFPSRYLAKAAYSLEGFVSAAGRLRRFPRRRRPSRTRKSSSRLIPPHLGSERAVRSNWMHPSRPRSPISFGVPTQAGHPDAQGQLLARLSAPFSNSAALKQWMA